MNDIKYGLTLGLAMGATWMGWQAFPDEVTATKARAEMLDETIDILTLMYQGRQFDYDGKHYHLKLTTLDEMHYPPQPVQQPRIPLWCVGVWPREKSLERGLKCDGSIVEKMSHTGEAEAVTPTNIDQIRTYVNENRTLAAPFDIVTNGKTMSLDRHELQDKLLPLVEAGITWWVEGLWEESEEVKFQRIQEGPPDIAKTK